MQEIIPLAAIPFDKLKLGMEVISARNNPGLIIKLDPAYIGTHNISYPASIMIHWCTGNVSVLLHKHAHEVKIRWPM